MENPSTSSAHTPGTWEVHRSENRHVYNGEVHYCVEAHTNSSGLIVADVETQHGEEQGLANARLIAAAPELLEALKGLLYCAEQSLNDERPSTCDCDACRVCRDKARQAITKAA